MAHFSTTGSVHGNYGTDYPQAPQHAPRQHQGPPPNNFGIKGRIASMLQKYGDRKAEQHMNYVFGLQEQLDQQRQYRETGTYQTHGPGYPPPDGFAPHHSQHAPQHPANDPVSAHVMDMFERMHDRIASLESQLQAALGGYGERLNGDRPSTPRPATATSGLRTPTRTVVDEHEFQGPRVVDVTDTEPEEEEAPPLPPRTSTASEQGTVSLSGRTTGARDRFDAATPRSGFPPPPLHPTHPRAEQRRAEIAAFNGGSVDIENWRDHTATSITQSGRDADDEDRMTDNTTGTSRHRPVPTPAQFRRKQDRPGTTPGVAAGAEQAERDAFTADQASILRANARVELEAAEEGRKTAERTTRS